MKGIIFALAATQGLGVLAWQPNPAAAKSRLRAREPPPYPICSPATNPECIAGGKYLIPDLETSDENSKGDKALKTLLKVGTHRPPVSWEKEAAGQMPEPCYRRGVVQDGWKAADFIIYNVTYDSDCDVAPFVICWNKLSPKSVETIAQEIGRLPATIRQAASAYMVYGDKDEDNPAYDGFIGAYAEDGLILGRASGYFPVALVHEITHCVDSTLASPDAVHPRSGSAFSQSSAWKAAVDKDGFAITPHGANKSYTEDFGDVGRAVLLDAVFEGGLAAYAKGNTNLTQIDNQLNAFKSVAGEYYNGKAGGGKCSAGLKFPFPALLTIPKT